MSTATTTTTPNMGMVLPVPSVEVGPTWATELITAFTDILDAHDHSSGKGVRINTAGININADLAINGYRLGASKSVALTSLGAALVVAPDLGTLQNVGGDLYWVNSGGSAVKITAGGTINSAALVSSVWAQVAVNTNISIAAGSTNIDHVIDTSAPRTITLPAANAVSAGRFYVLKDQTGSAATNNVTITAAGTDTIDGAASTLLKANYASVLLISDGTSKWSAHWYQPTGPLNLSATNAVSGVLPTANMAQATTGTSGAVQLAGDLAGTSSSPVVTALTGSAGTTLSRCAILKFDEPLSLPEIVQTPKASAGTGTNMLIQAQAGNTSGMGGVLQLQGGDYAGTPSASGSGVQIKNGTANKITFESVTVGNGATFIHNTVLNGGSPVTGFASFGSGDGVTLLANARTVPGSPSAGVVMYATSNRLGFNSSAGFTNKWETDFSSASSCSVGAASGLPGAPAGYFVQVYNGTTVKVPYWNA